MAKDPVCGMEVEEQRAAGERHYAGRTYYFCSRDCLTRFDREPARYAAPQGDSGERAHRGH